MIRSKWPSHRISGYEKRTEIQNEMNELTDILTEIRPGKKFAGVENFFDEGVLDSLDLTALVASLESRYGIFLDVDEIVPENFRNLEVIKTLLTRKGVSV